MVTKPGVNSTALFNHKFDALVLICGITGSQTSSVVGPQTSSVVSVLQPMMEVKKKFMLANLTISYFCLLIAMVGGN